MNGLIYAAGLGTRLMPLTRDIPKALVEVAGKPMLERVIERLKAVGVNRIVVNVHHHADKVVRFLQTHDFGVEILVSDESDLLLDTGGGLWNAQRLFAEGPVIVHNADILTDFPLADIVADHTAKGNVATLLVSERKSSRKLRFSADSHELIGWENLNTGERLPEGADFDSLLSYARSFCGISVLSPEVFARLNAYQARLGKSVFPIMPFYVAASGLGSRFLAHEMPPTCRWFDIGTIERLQAATAAITGEISH